MSTVNAIQQSSHTNTNKEKENLLLAGVGEESLLLEDIRSLLLRNLDGLELAIPDTTYLLENQGFIKNCTNIHVLLRYLERIPYLNQTYLKAIKEIVAYNESKGKDPALEKRNKQQKYTLRRREFSTYKEYIQECAKFIYDRYGYKIDIVGKYDGQVRGDRYDIKTPYGTFSEGKWYRRPAPEDAKYGDIHVEREGFMIGDRVRKGSLGYSAVVIDAGHDHNSKGQGTATMVIMYDDKTTEKVAPWTLEKVGSLIVAKSRIE